MINSTVNRTCNGLLVLLLSCLVTLAHGEYAGPLDDELSLDANEQRRQNNISYGLILTQIVAHDAAIPFGFAPEPVTSLTAETIMNIADGGLKYTKAYLVAPPDLAVTPLANGGCEFELSIPQTRALFTNNLGFTPRLRDDFLLIPESFPSLRDETISYGPLGVPEIVHANSDVILRLDGLTAGISSFFPEADTTPRTFMVQAGEHELVWRAQTQVAPVFDLLVPAVMTPLMASAEFKFGKYVEDLLAQQRRLNPTKIMGSLPQSSRKDVVRIVKRFNRRVNFLDFIKKRWDKIGRNGDIRDLLEQILNVNFVELGKEAAGIDSPSVSDRLDSMIANLDAPTFVDLLFLQNTSVERARTQQLTVYDQFRPTIMTTSPNVSLEASDIGGATYARYAFDLEQTITAFDECGREVTVRNDAPEVLPLGETVVTWTVRDQGPALPSMDPQGIGYFEESTTQTIFVEDTQAPILVPPPGLVIESDTAIDVNDYPLGQPLVVDLADLHPDVDKSILGGLSTVDPGFRTVVTWSATDDGVPTPNTSTGDQLVTVKTPGSNTPPTAQPASAETLTSKPVDIVLTGNDPDLLPYSHDPGGEPVPDPLSFRIDSPPQNGEFVAPLLPFFINDYRTDKSGSLIDYINAQPDAATLMDEYIEAVNTKTVWDFLNSEFCLVGNDAPVDFIFEPLFMHVTDDGEQYFLDHALRCDPNGTNSPPWEVYPRISRWDRNGVFLGHTRIDDNGGGGIVNAEAFFQIDAGGSVYFVNARNGGEQVVYVQRCDANLTDTSANPSICGSSDFGPIDNNDLSANGWWDPRNAFVDLERELVYVTTDYEVAVFDFREESPGGPRNQKLFIERLTDDAGNDQVLGHGDCPGNQNPVFLNSMQLDSAGNLYVSDVVCSRVHKFTPSGFDESGNFVAGEYVGWMGRCDGSNNQACESGHTKGFSCTAAAGCTAVQSSGSEVGQFNRPAFLAMDPNDILYVADYSNSRIQRFGTDGTFAGVAASAGNGINAASEGGFVLGNMGPPKHVSVNSKNFFVVDQSENFVHVFDTSPFKDITPSTATVSYVSDFAFHSATDSFTYSVDDGLERSASAQVSIQVNRNYRQPQPTAQVVAVNEDDSVVILLSGSDPDGIVDRDFNGLDTLTFSIVDAPQNGKLMAGGDAGEVTLDPGTEVWTYQPGPDYFGDDSFTFTVRDEFTDAADDGGIPIPEPYGEADPATVDISVAPVNDIPVIEFVPPDRVAAGFPMMLDAFAFDDFGDRYSARVHWGDGSTDYDGGVHVDENGTPDDPNDDAVWIEGIVYSEDSLRNIGRAPVNAVHTFDGTGSRNITLCFKDYQQLETCRSMQVEVESLAALGAGLDLDVAEIRDGIVFSGRITAVNGEPSAGVQGLDASNVRVSLEIPPELVLQSATSPTANCSVSGDMLDCNVGTLAPGESATVDVEFHGVGTLVYDVPVDLLVEVRSDTPSIRDVAVGGASVQLLAVDLDRDDDGLPNIFEASNGVDDPAADDDGDGLDNAAELEAGTSPTNADSDGDGISDGDELSLYGSDPLETDSDSDGIADADEINLHGTDPSRKDSDDDGLSDNWELDNGYDPLVQDSDGDPDADGLDDRREFAAGTDHLNPDSDGDSLSDGDEVLVYGSDPLTADTDEDGLDDPDEITAGTTVTKPDTDDDGLYDGAEVFATQTDPLLADTDRDGMRDGFEDAVGRNPVLADYALAAGGLSSCAITDNGIECWGRNTSGEAPALVPGLTDPQQVTMGYQHGCAIDRAADGSQSLVCWGSDGFGQITPNQPLVHPVQAAAGAYHTCVIDEEAPGLRTMKCWGRDNFGQVSTAPGNVEAPLRLVSGISGSSSCVLDDKTTGLELVCWGQYNNANSSIPSAPLAGVSALALGSEHGCVVAGGERSCWGLNDDGQAPPEPAPSASAELSLGGFHSCSLETSGADRYTVDCWGRDVDGQATVPGTLAHPLALASGSHHSCAFDDGSAKCWGVATQFDFGQAPVARILDIDPDADGILTADEIANGTNPIDPDTDGDRIDDATEIALGTDPTNPDTDGDGLVDGVESIVINSNPLLADSDADGMSDDWEVDHGLDPTIDDAAGDLDGDGVDNGNEFSLDLDPTLADTDNDGLTDGQEVAGATDPSEGDTDGDGMLDGWELAHGFDPLDDSDALLDSDGDGLLNHEEFAADTDPHATDTDGDGMPDAWETRYGLDPTLDDAAADLDRDGLNNVGEFENGTVPYGDDIPPVLTLPPDVVADSTGPFTDVPIGTATATDGRDGPITPVASDTGPFPPGGNAVTWTAADLSGNVAEDQQAVDVIPQVRFDIDQSVPEGETATVVLSLNGAPVTYPVGIAYTVSGSASNFYDHNAIDGTIVIAAGLSAELGIDIVADGEFEGDETLTFTLGTISNAIAGAQDTHTITIIDGNARPAVQIYATQEGRVVTTAAADAGPITVHADVQDPNSGDAHSIDWSGSDTSAFDPADAADESYMLDPATMNEGFYRIAASVTDNGLPAQSTSADMLLHIIQTSPLLQSTQDSDADGIDDLSEGIGDADNDRVPDYLDAYSEGHLLPLSGLDFLVETEPGLDLRLGADAFRIGARAGLSERDLAEDVANGYPNGVADFEVLGITPGHSALVVLPLQRAIPGAAAYRKLRLGQWQDFTVDPRNGIATAPGSMGACPSPGDALYVEGLNPGHGCVQLLIEDGGPNDADGLADGIIRDPGGLAVPVNATLTATAGANQTVAPGARDVVMLLLDIDSESGDAELDALRLAASGSGNDVNVVAVHVYVDIDRSGTVDEGDELIGSGSFDSDNGELEIRMTAPYPIGAGTTRILVTYDL